MPASSTHRGAAMEARCSPKCVGGVGGGVDCGAWGWRWRRGEARREDETRNRHVCERLNHTKKKKSGLVGPTCQPGRPTGFALPLPRIQCARVSLTGGEVAGEGWGGSHMAVTGREGTAPAEGASGARLSVGCVADGGQVLPFRLDGRGRGRRSLCPFIQFLVGFYW